MRYGAYRLTDISPAGQALPVGWQWGLDSSNNPAPFDLSGNPVPLPTGATRWINISGTPTAVDQQGHIVGAASIIQSVSNTPTVSGTSNILSGFGYGNVGGDGGAIVGGTIVQPAAAGTSRTMLVIGGLAAVAAIGAVVYFATKR